MARSGRRGRRRVRETPEKGYAPGSGGLSGVLYDSDVVIEILRGRAAVVRAALALEGAAVPTYCTAITWAEIYAGIRQGEEPTTRAFFEARGEVALDSRTGRRAGAYLARYSKSHAVEIADALIAAAAATSGLQLWTLNRKHYPMGDVHFFDAEAFGPSEENEG
jgi:predicted nucleic acid-binding protein